MSESDATRDDFEQFVAARMSSLLRTAYLLTGDHHDAQDLVQVALIKSVPHWRRISGAPDAYVRRVMVNENISRWRRRRWREVPTAAPPDTPPQTIKKIRAPCAMPSKVLHRGSVRSSCCATSRN